ncbi:MAG: ester cyclase [Anaerolineae bacterium]|nr:ester cyclase [Anaerolineae bacterium]NUQ02828.1 ester cyclase [Anaerolineae bacterium]
MSVDANKMLVSEFHQVVMVERRLDEVAQFMRDPLLDRDSKGVPEPLDRVKRSFAMYFSAFPDLQSKVEDITAEADKVVCRLTLTGTHQGEFMGAAPTGKSFSASAIHIFRIVDGKITERWEWVDRMGIRNQLGIQN